MDPPGGAVIVRPKLSNMADDLPAFRKQVVENLYKHVEYLSVKLPPPPCPPPSRGRVWEGVKNGISILSSYLFERLSPVMA